MRVQRGRIRYKREATEVTKDCVLCPAGCEGKSPVRTAVSDQNQLGPRMKCKEKEKNGGQRGVGDREG